MNILTDGHICAVCLEYAQWATRAEYVHQRHLPWLREIMHSRLPPLLLQQWHQKKIHDCGGILLLTAQVRSVACIK